ncbi:50S ribosomal protein L4 [Candidatus Sumerlaeota bacterium]|nr:50S ribosomal protein L4 [Candidatus Sumerlaeota bacterium]MBI3735426.1 50S ribosomal protein L4 [Candidatus Sumerlaeota bacterium]
MAKIAIKSPNGNDAGTLDLNDDVFGIEPDEGSVRAALNNYLSNQRRGTHSTKTRGFVSGGGKKPWKQKHTGRARQGSIRAPQWRGGAIIFGPSPRDYSYSVSKQVRQNAICSILSELARSQRLIAVEDFGLSAPKTKEMAKILSAIGVSGSALVLTEPTDTNVIVSARNIPSVSCVSVESPNVFDFLTHDYVVAKVSAIKRLEGVYA